MESSPVMCDPQEVQAVKDALAANSNNLGIGILHEPTGHIHLKPFARLLPFLRYVSEGRAGRSGRKEVAGWRKAAKRLISVFFGFAHAAYPAGASPFSKMSRNGRDSFAKASR